MIRDSYIQLPPMITNNISFFLYRFDSPTASKSKVNLFQYYHFDKIKTSLRVRQTWLIFTCLTLFNFKKMIYVFLATILPPLLLNVTVGDRQDKALKFGNSAVDYIIYQPDMGPLQNALSVCSWVRSLRTSGTPSWLSYQ